MIRPSRTRLSRLTLTPMVALLVAGCEAPPIETVQTGFRGLGMALVADEGRLREDVLEVAASLPSIEPPPPEAAEGPPGEWENVQVLGDLTAEQFNQTMLAMTTWVAADYGCAYCHVVQEDGTVNFASDDIYTKRVSRNMLRMVREVNSAYDAHVQDGVTCFSCHRGEPVPQEVWYYGDAEPLRHYLDRDDVRVLSDEALTGESENRTSIKQTEYTYWLMIHMSNSLGVNCTFCHNSPRWGSWEESPPQRVTALRGIRMTRAINNDWILPLTGDLPAERLGPMGDVPKVSCATCHQGAYIPLYGAASAEGWAALHAGSAGGATMPADPTLAPADTAAIAAPADTAAAGTETPGAGGR